MKDRSIKTKDLILRTAYELFSTNGYDKTPVSLILERAGMSKGGFYHHFRSKEEILDSLARLLVDSLADQIKRISDDEKLTALEKFNSLIHEVHQFRTANRDQLYKLFETFLRKENLVLKDKIDTYTLKVVKPAYVKIIQQGIDEGDFHTSSPELAAETIIRTAPDLRLKMVRLYLSRNSNENYRDKISKVADFLEEFVLKILGAEKKSIPIANLFKSYFLGEN